MQPAKRVVQRQERVTRAVIGILAILHFVYNLIDFIYNAVESPETPLTFFDWFMLGSYIAALIGGILFIMEYNWALLLINVSVLIDFLVIAWSDIGVKIVSHIAIFTFSAQFLRHLQRRKKQEEKKAQRKAQGKKESLTLDDL